MINLVDGDTVEATMVMDVWPAPRAQFMKHPEISENPWDPLGDLLGNLPTSEIYDVSIREYDIPKETGKLKTSVDPQTFPNDSGAQSISPLVKPPARAAARGGNCGGEGFLPSEPTGLWPGSD
ncbi:hypothetical protein [Nocardia sp. NPDC127526]|uniref:hypothetical protein n=1 Tax=Nocardia sp. NPDC127526 TaxID=3345393 RepID=UPI0036296121